MNHVKSNYFGSPSTRTPAPDRNVQIINKRKQLTETNGYIYLFIKVLLLLLRVKVYCT